MQIKSYLLRFWNFWPPFFFSGIKITKFSPDFRYMAVKLKLRFWNANYVGTQFGGSIFAMADPFYMIMLMKNLGREYTIWDKSSRIEFLKPGRSDLFAEFRITEDDLKTIQEVVAKEGKTEWYKQVPITNADGEVVAQIDKTLYIRKKKPKDTQSRPSE